jgi:farnesyl diphosphate synthase
MVGGQSLDLEAEKIARPASASAAQIQRIHNLKTGALIAFSCESGAILGQGSAQERAALRTYGEAIGLAFQMADDLLDASGSSASVGKKVAKDAAAGKATFVSIAGLDGARAELARVLETAVAALAPFGERASVFADAAHFVASRTH